MLKIKHVLRRRSLHYLLKNPSDVVTDKYRFDKSLSHAVHQSGLRSPTQYGYPHSRSAKTALPHVSSGFRCAGLRVVHA